MPIRLSIIISSFFIVFSGCVTTPTEQPTTSEPSITEITACETACLEARAASQNLDNGPCLLNPIPDFANYVCDVAHNPRTDMDNNPENQCSAFGETAHHFVEVDPSCEFIRER